MKNKEEKEKAKARNEEIGKNERAVAHPPISLTFPVHTVPPAPMMHCTKVGLSPERSYVRLANVNGLSGV